MPGVSRILLSLAAVALLRAETVRFRERALEDVVAAVPGILASQDAKTGRFGTGIWIVTDQNLMLPLEAASSYQDSRNPYYQSEKLLHALMAAGDALIDDQDADGRWEFRKKDGSKWGRIYMPWTYSRWVRTGAVIRGAMPPDRRARWEKALRLGYTGIAKDLSTARVQNIPAHHAMGLYFAGQVEEPAWRKVAADYLHRVAAAQHADGYWSENKGPVVLYGFVYVDALGTYYGLARRIGPARAAQIGNFPFLFHLMMGPRYRSVIIFAAEAGFFSVPWLVCSACPFRLAVWGCWFRKPS
jgi:hypothetical protein